MEHNLLIFWTDRREIPYDEEMIVSFCSESVQDKNIVTLKCQYCGQLSGTNSDDLEWPWRSLLTFETFVIAISPEIQHVLSVMCVHVNQTAHVSILLKRKDFSRSQTVTYTVKVVTSRKRYTIEMLLLQTTNKKWCDLSRSGNRDDLEWISRSYNRPVRIKPFVQLWSSWQNLNWQRVARSLCDSGASCKTP